MGFNVTVGGHRMSFTRKPTQEELEQAKAYAKRLDQELYKVEAKNERNRRERKPEVAVNPGTARRRAKRRSGFTGRGGSIT